MVRARLSPIAIVWVLVALRDHLDAMETEAGTLHAMGEQTDLPTEISETCQHLLSEICGLNRTLVQLEDLLAKHNYLQMRNS